MIRNLPDEGLLTEILTEVSGESGQNGSKSVKNGLVKTGKNRTRILTGLVETLVDGGNRTETPCAESLVAIEDSIFTRGVD